MNSKIKFNPNDRHILVITGKYDDCLRYAKSITRALDSIEITDTKQAQNFLGQETDAVIYSLHESFNPNAFGAITGTILGGGFLILLRPAQLNKDSLFLTRFNQSLENSDNTYFLDVKKHAELSLAKPPKNNISNGFATTDQESAVAAIINVVKGHRRRPLLLTSDRGRGKSAALGLAAAALAKQGIDNIIICAPSKKMAEMVFKHAGIDSQKQSNLTFYSPDELNQQQPSADLVLIDEAAAIPLPLLSNFLKYYSRIVFASTQHGYEGCGRGFAVNFRKVLNTKTPQWKSCELKMPVRWQKNDTLEAFTFDALLLDSDVPEKPPSKSIKSEDCILNKIDKQELLSNNDKLKQLFGLLVSAHYQTKPSDLMQILDDENMMVFTLEADKTIVAVSLAIREGNIEQELIDDIFAGKRRLQGHLVAQALSSSIGIKDAPKLSGERISRIAVHPQLQNHGLGSFMLNSLFERSDADYLSTCYGATEPLINFWKKNNFKSIHLGIKRDASSGSHSVTMLKAKTEKGKDLCRKSEHIFDRNFSHLLVESFKNLETKIIRCLLPNSNYSELSKLDVERLESFAKGHRGYENSIYLISNLISQTLKKDNSLNKQEQKIVIKKVLQKQSWDTIKTNMHSDISGKKEALVLLRSAISKLLKSL